MKKTFVSIFVLVMLLTLTATTPVSANLYFGIMSHRDFGNFMAKVVKLNPNVDFKRMKAGDSYRLPDGTIDRLEVGDTRGIWGREYAKAYNTPTTEPTASTESTEPALKGKPPLVTTLPAGPENYTTAMLWKDYGWLAPYIVIALFLVFLIWRALLSFSHPRNWHPDFSDEDEEESWEDRELRLDPITSGKPYVAGGIEPVETRRLEKFFDQRASSLYRERNPNLEGFTFDIRRIGPIQVGTISGEGLVGYLGTTMKPRRIPEPGIRAYQARYRFPDGTEEVLQTLQACMNPVHSGDTYKGFVFIEDKPVVSDEECRGKHILNLTEDKFSSKDTIPVSIAPPTVEVVSSVVTKPTETVSDHEDYDHYAQSGGHRAARYQKDSRRLSEGF